MQKYFSLEMARGGYISSTAFCRKLLAHLERPWRHVCLVSYNSVIKLYRWHWQHQAPYGMAINSSRPIASYWWHIGTI